MTLNEIIKTNNWISVSASLLEYYPEEEENRDGFALVFEKLQLLHPEESDMYIEIKNIIDDFDGECYVDVGGRYKNPKTEEDKAAMALEFTPWNRWLGMEISAESLEVFSEPEIIAHCLYEMTFVGFEEKEIQEELKEIKEEIEEIKSQDTVDNDMIMNYINNLINGTDEENNDNKTD